MPAGHLQALCPARIIYLKFPEVLCGCRPFRLFCGNIKSRMANNWETSNKQDFKPDLFPCAVDAIGPETDFTLETDGKMCTKNK